MENIFGGQISFESKEQIENFVNEIDEENGIKFIESCLAYCQQNGLFSIEESYYIHKVISKLKNNNEHNR